MHSIAEFKQIVEVELKKLSFNSSPKDLYDPIVYMLGLDAKRLRPIALLCGNELFGGDYKKAMMPALGIEVFHNFTLMHDDIMDNAPLRRSNQTVHTRWNSNVAILSGDTMFVKSCQLMLMTEVESIRPVMELFHKTAVEVCEGQQLDMDFESRKDVSIADYIEMITFKTAVLLAASMKIGALIAGAPPADATHLYEFGKHIGIAFQLKDDLLDVFGDDKKFGKLKGGDIVANKKTFLLLEALALAQNENLEELNKWINAPAFDAIQKVNAVTAIYEKLNIKHLTELEMDKHFNAAISHFNSIDVAAPAKQTLLEMAERLMVREV
ncbi:MAG: polyprenyl synthetase family protein [Bacteroidetes bacterium]|nr:polyprenyl synthetase family protein [Bacteroidota bacterium]